MFTRSNTPHNEPSVHTGFKGSWNCGDRQLATAWSVWKGVEAIGDERPRLPDDLQGSSFRLRWLGPPVVPFYPFFGEGSPTKMDYRKNRVPLF